VLEHTKGSPLDIRPTCLDRAEILLLSLHAQQFTTLGSVYDYWSNIHRFSEAAFGALPLFRILKISAVETQDPETTPSLPLFGGVVELKNFLRSRGILFLNYFAFPNFTTFELIAMPKEFPASKLLDLLEASPTQWTVRIEIAAEIHTEDVPPESLSLNTT
jgi:hypothetical protein